MTIPLTPAQFAALKAKLLGAPDVTVTQTGADSGNVITDSIEFSYAYDGTDLTITVIN